jgi:hypothetical protein
MEEKKPINHIVAGLLIAGLVIILSIILGLMGQTTNQSAGWISYIIIIGGLILFINLYGKSKNNYVSFGELFSYGFKATAVVTIMFVLFFIIYNYLSPELKEQAIQAAREQMENRKGATDDQIETSVNMVEKYYMAFAVGGTILGFLIIGAIGSLIGAAVTKKRPKNPFELNT